MTLRSLAARGLSFAHLAGMSPKAAKSKAENDDENKGAKAEGDSDDEEENQNRDDGNARADDDEDETDDNDQKSGKAKSKAKSKADDGDETKDYADDDDDDANAEEDGDDQDEEMRGKSAVARARRREQARCAAIMGHKAAGRNVVLAASLAFNTRMSRNEAIAVLQSTPAASTAGQGRQARNPNLGTGGEMSRSAGASWDRAFSKVAGKRA